MVPALRAPAQLRVVVAARADVVDTGIAVGWGSVDGAAVECAVVYAMAGWGCWQMASS